MELLNFKTGINFGTNGNLNEFGPVGFSLPPGPVSAWSEARVAELTFRAPSLRRDVRFVIEVFPYLADGLIAMQECWVFLNGLFVHYASVKKPLEMTFTVQRTRLDLGANRLSFALPNATAPRELGLGDDLRLLGIGFVKLSAGPA